VVRVSFSTVPVVFICLLLLLSPPLEAGINSWTRIGPSEFLADSVVIDPTDSRVVYVGALSGVLRSNDDGANWAMVTSGMIGYHLLIAPHDPDVLYARTSQGLKKSTDKGDTWLSYPIPDGISHLTVDPWNSENLFAGSYGRMLKSGDGGKTWEVMPGWTEDGQFRNLIPHPFSRGVMFASGDWGLARSDNGGVSWRRLQNAGTVHHIAFHPTDPRHFYIGYGGSPRWTEDGGETFLPLPKDLPNLVADIGAIMVDPDQPDLVLFGGADGYGGPLFYRSTDGGTTWKASDSGFEQTVVSALVPDRLTPGMIWAATNAGIYRSLDRGLSWQSVTTGLMRGFDGPRSVSIEPDTGRLYVITGDSQYSWRVHVSSDAGATWRRTKWEYRAFATDQATPGTLYGATTTGFFKSDDSGATWTASSQPPQELNLILPVKGRPELIYGAGEYSAGSFWKSTDGGATWTSSTYEPFQGWTIWRLAASPDGKTLYALTQLGLYKSVDEGASWNQCAPLPGSYDSYGTDVLLDSADPKHLLVSTRVDGVYESFDGGQTLNRLKGLPDIVSSLAGDFGEGSTLYVGSDAGVYLSEDDGLTWSLLNRGLPERPVNRVVPDSTNRRRIYASVTYNIISYTRSPVSYLPRLSGNGGAVGFAVANPGAQKVDVTLNGFNAAGQPLSVPGGENPVHIELQPGRQHAQMDIEAFGSASLGEGWVRFDSSALGPGAMFSYFTGDLAVLDTWEMPASPARSFLFAELGLNGFARFYFGNPGSEETEVRVTLVGRRGEIKAFNRTIRLAPQGVANREIRELFPGVQLTASDYLEVSSDRPFLAFQIFGRESKTIAGMGGLTAEHFTESDFDPYRRRRYLPQFTVGNTLLRSVLTLINPGNEPTWAYIQLMSEEGLLPYVGSVNIPAKTKVVIDDRELFPELVDQPLTAALRLFSDIGGIIVGQVTFQDEHREQLLTALPLSTDLNSSLILGHLASGVSFFTGIAMMNPAQEEVEVALKVYSPAGMEIASTTVTLAAEGRRSKLLTEYFPELQGQELAGGYVKVTATRPISCFGIYAPANLSCFAMIPGQTWK